LSANADYDVSIVESFAPPANWLPGQEVNKDVYAVNTGTVDAFVEETVSGILTVTKEVKDTAAGNGAAYADATPDVAVTPKADDIKLTKAERYVIEDGSYLALAPKASNFKAGDKVVAMNPDFDDENGYTALTGDFGPDAPGLYVFRRSIKVDNDTQVETFKYDAYYFDGQDFYKVTNLKVVPNTVSYAGDNDKTDGNLKSATYNLVKEVSDTVVPTLKYEAKTAEHPNRLVATYDVGNSSTDLADLAEAYDDALIAYDVAWAEYQGALNDNSTANGNVSSANNTLQEKIAAIRTAENQLKTLKDALTAATKAKDDKIVELYGSKTGDEDTYTPDSLYGKYKSAQADLDAKMVALYGYPNGGDTTKDDPAKTYDPNNANATSGHYTLDSAYGQTITAQDAIDAKMVDLYGNKAGGEGGPTTTSGGESGKYTSTSLYGVYQTKLAAVPSNDDKTAFLNWLSSNGHADVRTKIENGTVTYNDIASLNVTNDNVGFNYWQKLVEAMAAKDDVDAKKRELATAQSNKAQKDQAYQDALDAKSAAETKRDNAKTTYEDERDNVLGTSSDAAANGDDDTLWAKEKYAQNQVDAKMVDLYGHKNGDYREGEDPVENDAAAENKYTKGSLYGQYKLQRDAYEAALAAADSDTVPLGASQVLDNAKAKLAAATQAKAEAKKAYEDAVANPAANELKININLSDDVVTTTTGNEADKWELLPETLVDQYNNETTALGQDNKNDTAKFYYTGILGAGETSSKLIDSVELDKSVTNDMFKSFDFDLNVALKSAQIAYDADGNVTADATTELDANAKLPANATTDSAVNWTLK